MANDRRLVAERRGEAVRRLRRDVPSGRRTGSLMPHEDRPVDLSQLALHESCNRRSCVVSRSHAGPVGAEREVVEGADNLLTLDPAAVAEMRAEVRAVRLDDAHNATARAIDDEILAHEAPAQHASGRQLVGERDGEPAIRVRASWLQLGERWRLRRLAAGPQPPGEIVDADHVSSSHHQAIEAYGSGSRLASLGASAQPGKVWSAGAFASPPVM